MKKQIKCLWCEHEINFDNKDYQFCQSCRDNLEELEVVSKRFSMTEIAEIALKDFNVKSDERTS